MDITECYHCKIPMLASGALVLRGKRTRFVCRRCKNKHYDWTLDGWVEKSKPKQVHRRRKRRRTK